MQATNCCHLMSTNPEIYEREREGRGEREREREREREKLVNFNTEVW